MWAKFLITLLLPAVRGQLAEVKISTGQLIGESARTVPNGNQYYSFRGIPYAETPTRFEPAVPKKPWQGVYDARRDQPACIQGFYPLNSSEDCLFINIYTPSLSSEIVELFPVMFWIHGGFFTEGGAQSSLYMPDYFIDDGVLVVTINYRLGIFGFLSSGDDRVPGNNGLKDLVLGLKWVQENIRSFNGDPTRVTIFGQSAGAVLTSYLTISPLTLNKGYFVGAICQSGNALSPWGLQRYPARNYKQVLKKANCRSQGTRELDLACLQNLTTDEVARIQAVLIGINVIVGINFLNGIVFSPTYEVNHPEAALVEGSYNVLQNGSVPTVPVIMGVNSEESLSTQILVIRLLFLQADLVNNILVPQDMYASDEDKANSIIPAIKNYYFGTSPVIFSSDSQIFRFLSDVTFNKPYRQYFTLVGDRIPQYCYEFTYVGNNSKRHPDQPGLGRVSHAEETPYLWRSADNATLAPEDFKVKDKMVRLWTNFAKYGNPTHNSENDTTLNGFTWNEASVNGTDVKCLSIGEELEMIENPKESGYMLWYNLYETYGHPNDTY